MTRPTKKATAKELKRWLRKARRVFKGNFSSADVQQERGCDLARDVWRILDPEGWKRQ